MINIELIQQTPLKTDPFPYFAIEQALSPEKLEVLTKEFPTIHSGGSFNEEDLRLSDNFQALHQAIDNSDFRRVLSDKFDTDVSESPLMITYRGYSRLKDGRVHTDSKTKLLTILVYFNREWSAETGKLRILNSEDMNDVAEEVNPTAGCMIAFKVTDNCWHGYPSFEGTRNAIQINFLASEAANRKHRFFHKLSAKLKSV